MCVRLERRAIKLKLATSKREEEGVMSSVGTAVTNDRHEVASAAHT